MCELMNIMSSNKTHFNFSIIKKKKKFLFKSSMFVLYMSNQKISEMEGKFIKLLPIFD